MDNHRNDIFTSGADKPPDPSEQQRLDDAKKADRATRTADYQHGCFRLMAGTAFAGRPDYPRRDTAINNMLIDLMATMSLKDWLSRRQWLQIWLIMRNL